MLTATSRHDTSLTIFQAVLRSFAVAPVVGASLRAHTLLILRSACDIAEDPFSIDGQTLSESIELALCLRGNPELRQNLQKLNSLDSISPAIAEQLLTAFAPIAA